MRSTFNYCIILFVYVCLWTCQLIAGHLTHSLIILTDSYINLHKILDISLGILHLNVKLRNDLDGSKGVRLFGYQCSYQFKRLPVLGSFVNGLFLAALLMSAAIEGIQTCFHVSHLQDSSDEKSILMQHPATYPAILIGFALVGAIMQLCSDKAHEICREELDQLDSSDDLIQSEPESVPTGGIKFNELSASGLKNSENLHQESSFNSKRRLSTERGRKSSLIGGAKSSEPLPSYGSSKSNSQISLKSIKMVAPNSADEQKVISIQEISSSVAVNLKGGAPAEAAGKACLWDLWALIRFSASPVSLVSCAAIIYYIDHEFVTEIADASLAVLVVVLLFGASYPPMKRAGKVLLQTAADDLEPDELRKEIMALSGHIVDVREFFIWSLSSCETFERGNRICTCHLILNRSRVSKQSEVVNILRLVETKLWSYDISCATIQPILCDEAM